MNKRNVGLDLLRLLAMFMIVLVHVNNWGGLLKNTSFQIDFLPVYILEAFSICSVNCFILISGFFLIKQNFRLKKLIALIFEIMFYTWICFIVALIIKTPMDITMFVKGLFTISTGIHWFITCYIMLYIFFPFINKLIYSLSLKQKHFLAIITVLFFSVWAFVPKINSQTVHSGYSILWVSVLYYWGAYIRLVFVEGEKNHLFKKIVKFSGYGYIFFSLITVIFICTFLRTDCFDKLGIIKSMNCRIVHVLSFFLSLNGCCVSTVAQTQHGGNDKQGFNTDFLPDPSAKQSDRQSDQVVDGNTGRKCCLDFLHIIGDILHIHTGGHRRQRNNCIQNIVNAADDKGHIHREEMMSKPIEEAHHDQDERIHDHHDLIACSVDDLSHDRRHQKTCNGRNGKQQRNDCCFCPVKEDQHIRSERQKDLLACAVKHFQHIVLGIFFPEVKMPCILIGLGLSFHSEGNECTNCGDDARDHKKDLKRLRFGKYQEADNDDDKTDQRAYLLGGTLQA